MTRKFRRILSLLLASVMCLGLGVGAMAEGEDNPTTDNPVEDITLPIQDTDYNWGAGYDSQEQSMYDTSYLDISIDTRREYKKNDIINIIVDASPNLALGAIYYTIDPVMYKDYFLPNGNGFIVLKQDTKPVKITVTAVYEIGGLHLEDQAIFWLAAEEVIDPLSVDIVTAAGGENFDLNVGDSIYVSAVVAGGAYGSSYNFSWNCSGGLQLVSANGSNASFMAVSENAGAYISVDVSSRVESASARMNGQVTGKSTPFWISLAKSSIKMEAGDSDYIIVSGEGGTAPYRYSWESSDENVLRISAGARDDSVCTIVAVKPGTATLTVRGYDAEGKGDIAYCSVTVTGGGYNIVYNPSASVNAGEKLNANVILAEIISEYKRQTGLDLYTQSKMTIGTPSSTYGSFRYPDGSAVSKNTSVYALMSGTYFIGSAGGTFYSYYSIEDLSGNTISGNISINVAASKIHVSGVVISASNLEMPTWSSRNLSISVSPKGAIYDVVWASDNNNIVKITGAGNNVTLSSQGIYGIATVSARVTDLSTNQYTTVYCTVSVQNKSVMYYNPELTLTYGSDYTGTGVSDAIMKQFLSSFGVSLGSNAVVRFGSTGNTKGTLFLYNGAQISKDVNYSFRDLQLMTFTPNDVGTFSIPYSVSYSGFTLSGTMYVYINGSKLNVKTSASSVTLDPYSSQYVYLLITPANAYYRVEWTSDNNNIASITDRNTYYTTINSKGIAGTATVKATVWDANGISTVKNITVTVRNPDAYDYNPSTTTYIGSTTAGTTVYDSIRAQYRSIYGANLPDNASITFGVSDSSIAVRKLSDGRDVQANVRYTMGEYKGMYTQPSSSGKWTTPYTVTYDNNVLKGKIEVVIAPANANAAVTLTSAVAYLFNSPAAESTGADLLEKGISTALGKSGVKASYVTFETVSSGNGTLYTDSGNTAINANTNISVSDFGKLYFAPGTAGTFTTIMHVYDSRRNEIAAGYLYVVVPASAEGVTVVATTQNVTVDGKKVDAEIYNINGENYFKLRDIAQMLNGTNSQFAVGFNEESRTIAVTTSKAYVSVGTELVKGEDKSSTCVPSDMPIFVNGASVSPTAYNIGGNNFLRLRDLGEMLGFGVGYDEATRTVLITSR